MPSDKTDLVFSYTGYRTVTIKASSNMNVRMEPDALGLDEVVVIGKAPQPNFSMKEVARQGAAAASPSGGISFDLMQMLDFRARRHARRRMPHKGG